MDFIKSKSLYVILAVISLSTSLFVVVFGLNYISDPVLYTLHLQALVVLSSAGLLDYLYINRLERVAVLRYKLVKKALDQNYLFVLIPVLLVFIFWGNIIIYFIGIVLIRHFLNLRRAVEVINGNLKFSYLTYLGQILRNLIVLLPCLNEDYYLMLFILTFIFELLYVYFTSDTKLKFDYKRNIKVDLLKSNSFLYRFFYICTDVLFRVVFPYFMLEKNAQEYLFLVNMLLIPVAGFSLVGALVHGYILKNKIIHNGFLILVGFISTPLLFLFYSMAGVSLDPLVLGFFSFVAFLKFSDQIQMSYQVALGRFLIMRNIFLIGFIVSICMVLTSIFLNEEPLVLVLISLSLISILLILSNYILPIKKVS